MTSENLLEMKGIKKQFPGVKALDGVRLVVKKGEIHALMGENGAGKSTLIKILTGVLQADEGEILVCGKNVRINSVQKAQDEGINVVYQELNMIPYMSVAENIFIGNYPVNKFGNVIWEELYNNAQKILDNFCLDINAKTEFYKLSTALQQMVCIARSISRDCKVLVLDEPTSSLDAKEVKQLFTIMKTLRESNVGIIFITHRVDEVFKISDSVTILKDGVYIGTYATSELTKEDLITKMIGRKIDSSVKNKVNTGQYSDDDYILKVEHLAKFPKVRDVSFGVHKGEILGVTGLLGSGRSETADLIFGCEVPEHGTIEYKGEKMGYITMAKAVEMGMAFCTEDRRGKGIIPDMSVKNNISLASLSDISDGIFINNKKRNDLVNKYVKALDIKTPDIERQVKYLSGGNQQKTILARWLAAAPDFIILDEPTRGIDVGAKQEIDKLIYSLYESGISVLYISSEIGELIRNCHRVIVFHDGVSVGELVGDDINEDFIMSIIAHGENVEEK